MKLAAKIDELESALTAAGLSVVTRDRGTLLEAPSPRIDGAAQVILTSAEGPLYDTMAVTDWSVARLRIDVAVFLQPNREQAEEKLVNLARKVFDAIILPGLALPDGTVTTQFFENERVIIASIPVRVFHSH